MIISPYNIAFNIVKIYYEIFDMILNVFFILDIFFNLITSYKNNEGDWEISNKKIALKYLKSYFILDLLTSIPFDLIPMNSKNNNAFNKLL